MGLYQGSLRVYNYWIKDATGVYIKSTFQMNGGENTIRVDYEPDYLDVYRNGILLIEGDDYQAYDGEYVLLNDPAQPGDTYVTVAWAVEDTQELENGVISVGEVAKVNINNKIGYRFKSYDPAKYTDIGTDAIDLSTQDGVDYQGGAAGDNAIVIGHNSMSDTEGGIAIGKGVLASNVKISLGKFNKDDLSNYLEIGNGTDHNNRSNILEIKNDGLVVAPGVTSADIDNYGGNDVLVTKQWVIDNGSSGGGATQLNDLSDVNISAAADDQMLVYDANTGAWINETVVVDGGTF